MNLLKEHFDIAVETPDGIAKLRSLILTLAMQGKLVPQDPNDQPASELLEEIEAEKKRLVKEGKIKEQKPLPPIRQEEIPYEAPSGWVWTRLGEFGTWKSGSTPSRTVKSYYGGGIPWVKSGEVKQRRVRETSETITDNALKECPLSLNPVGSVLIAMYGANIGEVGILEIEATTNQAVCACKTYPGIDQNFLVNLLDAMKASFIAQGAGAAQPNISREKIVNALALLPPMKEQKRIVAKIEQLMSLCDKLEAQRNERDRKRLTVHASAMSGLLKAPDKPAFNRSWSFITRHFSDLYSVTENVAELKKAILQLAVMGKLVPQDPNDQPASELLGEIESEKKRLVKEGKIKEQKPLPPIKEEEIPYEAPSGWVWTRLGEFGTWKSGSTPSRTVKSYYGGGIPWVKSGEVKQRRIREASETITDNALKECPLSLNPVGSVLIAMYGANIGEVGILEIEATTNQAVCACKTYADIDKNFLLNLVDAMKPSFIAQGAGAAQPNISREKIVNALALLPPLKEQKRIVAKIDQLMLLADKLDEHLSSASAKRTAILDAVLARV